MDVNKFHQILLMTKQNENALLQLCSQQFLLQQIRFCRRRTRQRSAKMRERTLNQLREICLMYSVAVQSVLRFPLRKRLLGSYQRNGDWWDRAVPAFDDAEFHQHFRLKRTTFTRLCIALHDDLKPANSRTPPATLGVQKKVAIALFRLASSVDYKVVGEMFGVSKSTVCSCIRDVVEAVIHCLVSGYVRFPDEVEALDISLEFEELCFLPQMVGVIGETHIPIQAPALGHCEFVNNKGWASLIVQAVVDHNMWSITCQDPGQYNNAVLAGSGLYYRTQEIMPQGYKVKEGVEVPYYIVGNRSYPLASWLMKEYEDPRSKEQASFNTHLHGALRLVEESFTRLKGRWQLLLGRCDLDWNFMPRLVLACAILHNVAQLNGDGFDPGWVSAVEEANNSFPQPLLESAGEKNDEAGQHIRDALCAYMARNFPLADMEEMLPGKEDACNSEEESAYEETVIGDQAINNYERISVGQAHTGQEMTDCEEVVHISVMKNKDSI